MCEPQILPTPFNSAVRITVEQTFLSVQNGQAGTPDLLANDFCPVGQASVPVIEIFDINGRMVDEISADNPVGDAYMPPLQPTNSPGNPTKISAPASISCGRRPMSVKE
ncbi:hypothetical protein KAH81_03410 [bacterium]|nr:hypothetical protein [bacterium]